MKVWQITYSWPRSKGGGTMSIRLEAEDRIAAERAARIERQYAAPGSMIAEIKEESGNA